MNIKEIVIRKTIFITLPILLILIVALITLGITNAAGNTTAPQTEQTFTEEGDGYYIWVRAVDHAGNKSEWSEAQRVWIDNKGPSVPTITGGSSEYALSRTISVVTEADDAGASGIAYYEYYKKSGSDKPADSVTGTQVTTSATSQKFDTNIAGEYVFFRAVDVVGNKGAWSDGQQVYIDINAPTVTANNSSVTITAGQNYAMSSYFTVAANGTNTNITTTYKIGSTSYDNTSSLAAGTYTVTCTATKTGGNSNSASMTLVVKSAVPTTKTSLPVSDGTITIPDGVNVIEVYLWTKNLDSEYAGRLEFEMSNGSKSCSEQCYEGFGGTTTNTFYVAVTPGKRYTVTFRYQDTFCNSYSNGIYYSQDINTKSPKYDLRY